MIISDHESQGVGIEDYADEKQSRESVEYCDLKFIKRSRIAGTAGLYFRDTI
jgi:hypothetical protein